MTLWQRDWFLGLDGKHQLFVHYLRDHCDHAGVWQPAFVLFEKITGFRIASDGFLGAVNKGETRILVLKNGKWWLTGFIEDQYKTRDLKEKVNPHKGVINSIRFNKIPYKSFGYNITLLKGSEGVKDKDKDKDQSSVSVSESVSDHGDRGVGKGGRKRRRRKAFVPPEFDDFKAYCDDNGFSNIAERAYKYYADSDWMDSEGKPVLSWKGKLQAVWFREENRDKPEQKRVRSIEEIREAVEARQRAEQHG